MELGRLEKVSLREVWSDEARDFTPWLAQADNLPLLADSIGIELELDAQEKEVGPFRADILCKDAEGNWVLIENQLERTDHTHLGQLLTYAAGLHAVTIVWLASRFTDEHRAALDWLNEVTGEDVNFFGLEVELWRIGASNFAPKFNVVSQPNAWSRTVAAVAKQSEMTETKQLQLEYWTVWREHMLEHSKLKPQKPRPQHWTNIAIGRTGFSLTTDLNSFDNTVAVSLYINDDNAKAIFSRFEKDKDAIEEEFGRSLEWRRNPERKSSRIQVTTEGDYSDRESWQEQHEWIRKNLETFDRVFRGRIAQLEVSALPPEETNEEPIEESL